MSTASGTANCPYCGLVHLTICQNIKRIEYQPDGITIKAIEFRDAVQIRGDTTNRIFPNSEPQR